MTPNSIPKCMAPECANDCIKSKTTGKYLLHCSIRCKNTCISLNGKEKRKQTCLERYGATTNLTHSDTKEKIKQTNLVRHGVEHAMKSTKSKEKLQKTKLEKYGDPTFNNRLKQKETFSSRTASQRKKTHDKRKETVYSKYGVDFVTQANEFKQKSRETNLTRYGVEHACAATEIKNKISNTMRKNYGRHFNQRHLSDDQLGKLSSIDYLEQHKHLSLQEVATELNVTVDVVNYAYGRFNIDRTFVSGLQSTGEKEIQHFLALHGFSPEENVRGIIGRKELDIYLPDHKLAIEFHGLYWHCENRGKDRNYHLNKMIECNNLGINLIQITDHEWRYKRKIVESRLLAKLGKVTSVYARKCEVREVPAAQAAKFQIETHLQGSVQSSVRLGLFVGDELQSLMTFGKSRFNKKAQWELLRYSNALNCTIIGGASKLFSHFVKKYQPESIISYCDLRWNTGMLYDKLGFVKTTTSRPNYWYTCNYYTFESRVKYQKHKLMHLLPNFDPMLSEWENMKNNGYDRFWDCGNAVYVWDKVDDKSNT